jgi:hypothetical protein
MKLNIDTTGVTFLCTREPQAKTDRETGAPKVDRETGEAQWQIQLAALDSTGGEVLLVTVAGRPDIGVGSPVAVEDLVAIPWSQGDRSGVAYRAGGIRSLGTPIAGVTGSSPSSRAVHPSGKQAA